MNQIRNKLRNVCIGIRNIFRWLPVLWHDRDWDHSYLYIVLRKKLETMLQYHKTDKSARFEGQEYIIRDLSICVNILKRLEDDYWFENQEQLYAWLRTKKRPIPETYAVFDSTWLYSEAEVREKANRLVFKIISDNINDWWT